MPGAGTGKSCDACRHRKKKCDEKRPTCSRCEKLGIECVGVGQTRFKFRYAVSSSTNPGSFKRGAWSRNGHQLIKLSPSPTNDASRISNAFASLLNITDPGSSILSFGSMFAEVPMRMDQSPVLTAAAKTLTSSASAFYSGGSSLQAFTHYGKALTVLRADVASAVDNTHFSHTMCAIAILCLSHNLLHGQRAELEVHIRGLLYLLAKMPDVEPKTEFEKQALSLAWSLVIGESIMDPTIELDPRVVAKQKRRLGPVATASASFTTEFYSLRWENLINLPAQLQDPMSYDMEIRATYEIMKSESPRIITLAAQLFDAVQKTRIQKLAFQYILCETGNVEMLSMSLVLNSVLQILDVADGQKLVLECTNLIEETMKASERLDRFRPLGTARLPNALCLCWLLAPTPRLRETMREVLQEHIQDFRGVTWQDLAGRYDARFRHMRAQVRRRLSPLSIT